MFPIVLLFFSLLFVSVESVGSCVTLVSWDFLSGPAWLIFYMVILMVYVSIRVTMVHHTTVTPHVLIPTLSLVFGLVG